MSSETAPARPVVVSQAARAKAGPAFTATALLLGTWLVIGMYVDAWAHHHLSIETFFTPWHALLYSGAAANFVFLSVAWLNRRRSLPAGYELSIAGSILFGIGGFADLIWHAIFGIERDF